MNIRQSIVGRLAITMLIGLLLSPAWAQEAQPKVSKTDKPVAKQPPAELEEPPPEDAAVVAILATKPTTPMECVRAAKRLVDLGHPDVAKPFLKKVIDAKLNPQQLADLGEQFGSPMFLDWTNNTALLPEAKLLADAVVPAVKAKLEDAKRIAGLIAQLQDPVAEKRVEAMAGLQAVGRAAINPLVQVLADPKRESEYANVRTVLAGMGRSAREALSAILEVTPYLKSAPIQAILTLQQMGDPKAALCLLPVAYGTDGPNAQAARVAIEQLLGRVPSRAEAVAMLRDAAREYFDRKRPVDSLMDERVERWQWNMEKMQCEQYFDAHEFTARRLAARWSSAASALAPDDHELQLMSLTAMFEDSGVSHRVGSKTVDEMLAYAMSHGHPMAAMQAARLLGEIGTADELLYQGDKPTPLVLALQEPDRRVRMAALEAIVRLKPTKPFAGSSDVPKALAYFAASSGVRHALIGGSNVAESRDLAGMLAAAGFQTDTAATGKSLLLLATRSPDFEVAWIDVAIDHPEINLLLQELRRDPRTALLRVGLVARSGNFDLAERLAAHDPMAKAFARPHDEQAFRWQLDQLATLAPREFVDFAVRQRQAADALDLLAELSQTSGKLYNLRGVQDAVLVALYNPKLAVKAVAVLANLNSAECQRALVDVASRFVQPLATRQAAASVFRQSVQKYGLLLTTEEIRQQYQRYNESEKQDAATQKVLGLILDCLEVPMAKGFRGQGSGFSTPNHTATPNSDSRTPNPEP